MKTAGKWIMGLMAAQWVLLVGPAHPSKSSNPGTGKVRMEKIETDLFREREQYSKFHQREKELLEQLTGLEREMGEKKKSLTECQEKIVLSKEGLARLQAGLTRTEKSLSEVEERLTRRLVAFYKYARRGTIQVLASSRDLDDLGKRITYLRIITGGDRHLLQETVALRVGHRQQILSMKEMIASIERMEKEESSRLLTIKEDLDRKVLVLMKIHQEREFYETAVKELEVAAQRMRETLVRLERVRGVRQEASPNPFASFRGRLPFPCRGKVFQSYSPGGENGLRGIYIEPPAESEVKAVFPGRIDYSGHLRGYGEVVVVNHGSRFYTVSAYLSSRSREEGEAVNAGDVIGVLSKEESGSDPRLYFEIRKGEVSVDPLEWLKAD